MGVNGENTLPDGWQIAPLSQIAKVQTGVAKNSNLEGNAVSMPYLRVANVQDGRLDLREVKQIRVRSSDVSRCRLQVGDVLFTEGGDFDKLGRSVVWKGEIPECLHQNHIFAVRTSADALDPYFLTYLAAAAHGRQYFLSCAKQTTNLASINSTQLKAFPVLLPPLPEQRQIVQVLAAWFKAEELCLSLIEAKTRQRAALLSSLVSGKRQLSDHGLTGGLEARSPDIDTLAGNALVDVLRASGEKSYLAGIPRLGPVPLGWREVAFRDVLEVVERPVALKDDQSYQLVTAKRGRGGIVPRETLLGRQILTKTQFRVATGDFLISRRQIIHGACGVVPSSLDEAVVSNEYATLRVKDGLLLDYLRYLTHTDYFQMTCFHASVGVAIEKMVFRLEEWLNHKFHLPPEAEQRRIASCVGWLEHEIVLLSKQRDAVTKQKRGLMQLLLTGKLRVRTQ